MYIRYRNSSEKVPINTMRTKTFWNVAFNNLIPFFIAFLILTPSVCWLMYTLGTSIYAMEFAGLLLAINLIIAFMYKHNDSKRVESIVLDVEDIYNKIQSNMSEDVYNARFKERHDKNRSWLILQHFEIVIQRSSYALASAFTISFLYFTHIDSMIRWFVLICWTAMLSWQIVAWLYSREYKVNTISKFKLLHKRLENVRIDA